MTIRKRILFWVEQDIDWSNYQVPLEKVIFLGHRDLIKIMKAELNPLKLIESPFVWQDTSGVKWVLDILNKQNHKFQCRYELRMKIFATKFLVTFTMRSGKFVMVIYTLNRDWVLGLGWSMNYVLKDTVSKFNKISCEVWQKNRHP